MSCIRITERNSSYFPTAPIDGLRKHEGVRRRTNGQGQGTTHFRPLQPALCLLARLYGQSHRHWHCQGFNPPLVDFPVGRVLFVIPHMLCEDKGIGQAER